MTRLVPETPEERRKRCIPPIKRGKVFLEPCPRCGQTITFYSRIVCGQVVRCPFENCGERVKVDEQGWLSRPGWREDCPWEQRRDPLWEAACEEVDGLASVEDRR